MRRFLVPLTRREHLARVGQFRRRLATTSTDEAAPSEAPGFEGPANLRPDLDFDFLLNDANLEAIKNNIAARKGVGDIDAVRGKWEKIQELMGGAPGSKPGDISESKYANMWNELYDEASLIPNMSQEGVPLGSIDNAKKLSEWGEKREGDCLVAEKVVQPWRALLFPTEASGQRSYVLTGPLARLEGALLDYAKDRVCVLGFKPLVVADIVAGDVTAACGVPQRTQQAIQYSMEKEPSLKLSGTAEMGIAAFMRGRTFQEEQLPVRVVATSRCFRPEISKSASESKLYRVHEFTKVEMFVVCAPEQSNAELEFLMQIQKGTFQALGIHCRQMEMPTEELGASAARKIDVEAWMPGRRLYGEVSSASNCTDYQSRRLGIKYKTKTGETRYVHTCNGTALASTRAIISLIETIQTDKKGIGELPEVIRARIQKERVAPLRFQPAKPLV